MDDTTVNTVDTLDAIQTVTSTETISTTATETETIVADLYTTYLYRDADEAGLEYWSTQLESGVLTRAEITQSFMESEEFAGSIEPIARLYYSLLNRIPDQSGLEYWINEHRGGKSIDEIAGSFLQAEETQTLYSPEMDDAAFVTSLYQNMLGRSDVSAEEIAYWTNELADGMDRSEIVVAFSESEENIADTADEVETTLLYHGIMGRQPTDDELTLAERVESAADLIESLFAESGIEGIEIETHIPSGLDGHTPNGLNDHLPPGWFRIDHSDTDEEEADDVEEIDDDAAVITDDSSTDITLIGTSETTDSTAV